MGAWTRAAATVVGVVKDGGTKWLMSTVWFVYVPIVELYIGSTLVGHDREGSRRAGEIV